MELSPGLTAAILANLKANSTGLSANALTSVLCVSPDRVDAHLKQLVADKKVKEAKSASGRAVFVLV